MPFAGGKIRKGQNEQLLDVVDSKRKLDMLQGKLRWTWRSVTNHTKKYNHLLLETIVICLAARGKVVEDYK